MAACAGCHRNTRATRAGALARQDRRALRGERRSIAARPAALTHSGTPRRGAAVTAPGAAAAYCRVTLVVNDAFRSRRRWPSGVAKPLALWNVDEAPPQLGSSPAHRSGQCARM